MLQNKITKIHRKSFSHEILFRILQLEYSPNQCFKMKRST